MKSWAVVAFNTEGKKLETRKGVTTGQLERLVKTLAHETPDRDFAAYPEGQYPDTLDVSFVPEAE